MTEFLKLVARHYLDQIYAANGNQFSPTALSRYLFVYPNHRSSLFMGRYLSDLIREREHNEGRPIMAPRVTTISDLYSLLSPYELEDQMSLLFRLYGIFSRRHQQAGGQPESFDKFIFWGQMLLSDYNDIDKYGMELRPEMHRKFVRTLYSVVTDHKEVDVTFAGLDDDLAEVLAAFWKNIDPERLRHPMGESNEEKETFLRTWRTLYDVYVELNEQLEREHLTYEGMRQREVVQRLSSTPGALREALRHLGIDHVVMVCLTAITNVDRQLLHLMQQEGLVEFCWDWADPRLQPAASGRGELPVSHAAYFPSQYTCFPNALSPQELAGSLVPDAQRQVRLIEVPSGVGQADEARRQLLQWQREGHLGDPVRTAIVLPDEQLLFPMLYQIPQQFQPLNVTMGYSLRQSPMSALVDCLAALQFDARQQAGQILLNYKSVLALLSHGYLSRLAGDRCHALIDRIHRESLYEVPASLLDDEVLSRFVIVDPDPAVVGSRLTALMRYLLSWDEAREEEEEEEPASDSGRAPHIFEGYEREFIYNYLICIERLEELLGRYPEVRQHTRGYTFYLLLQRLVSGVQIPFSGEPLHGLQVMGVLETRSLDFDNLIILSMNEGVYPAKPQQNSFIPLSLRKAFGLPSQAHRDSVYAYHFYRMLSRASRVTLIYDSRTEGGSTGEVSRYVLQLKYLCPDIRVEQQAARTVVQRHEVRSISIRRDTPQVREALSEFIGPEGHRTLSATAIKDYLACPLRFYLKVVRQLYQQDEVKEGIDGSLFGSIVHRTLEMLYRPAEGELRRVISAEGLDRWIREAHAHRFESEVGRQVLAAFAHETNGRQAVSYQRIAAEAALDFVLRTLEHDRDKVAPFEIVGTELRQYIDYPVYRPDGTSFVIHLQGIYDRLDIVNHCPPSSSTPRRVLRIVDYKTEAAKSKMKFQSPEDLLTPKGSKVAFQVMLYSLLLDHARPAQLAAIGLDPAHCTYDSVSPHLYFIRSMGDEKYQTVLFQQGKGDDRQEVWDVDKYREAFGRAFQQVLCDIFDTPEPGACFEQTQQPREDCTFCQFRELCRKV